MKPIAAQKPTTTPTSKTRSHIRSSFSLIGAHQSQLPAQRLASAPLSGSLYKREQRADRKRLVQHAEGSEFGDPASGRRNRRKDDSPQRRSSLLQRAQHIPTGGVGQVDVEHKQIDVSGIRK